MNAKEAVLSILEYGSENAKTKEFIAGVLCTDERRVRKAIEELRNDGEFIVTSGHGYYLTTDINEIENYYYVEKARALSILNRLTHARRLLIKEGRKPKI